MLLSETNAFYRRDPRRQCKLQVNNIYRHHKCTSSVEQLTDPPCVMVRFDFEKNRATRRQERTRRTVRRFPSEECANKMRTSRQHASCYARRHLVIGINSRVLTRGVLSLHIRLSGTYGRRVKLLFSRVEEVQYRVRYLQSVK